MHFFLTIIFLALIERIYGQYGQPYVGGAGEFSFECKQTNVDVISTQNNKEYEIIAGNSFSYKCDFFVDTRLCAENRPSTACDSLEMVWDFPNTLKQIERQKGITRKAENTAVNRNDGYDIYENWFNLSNVGVIHNGDYSWKFNLRFEMRTVFEDSFRITTIDMLQINEPCKYNDSCSSNKCIDGVCMEKEPQKFPWLIVGIVFGVVVVLVAFIVWGIVFLNNKQKLIDRSFD